MEQQHQHHVHAQHPGQDRRAQAGALRLSVTDNGPGIAEADRSLVFERFYRIAGTDSAGTGFGLAIVAQAVARLHGTVSLETGNDGRGCRFLVELPCTP